MRQNPLRAESIFGELHAEKSVAYSTKHTRLVSIPHRYDYDVHLPLGPPRPLRVSIPHRYDYDIELTPEGVIITIVSIPHRYDYEGWERRSYERREMFQSHTGTITTFLFSTLISIYPFVSIPHRYDYDPSPPPEGGGFFWFQSHTGTITTLQGGFYSY